MSNISWANEEVGDALMVQSVQKAETHIDYDIHGVVAVRLIDCPPVEATAIAKKYGSLQRPLSRIPDIIVRFVKHLATPRTYAPRASPVCIHRKRLLPDRRKECGKNQNRL